MYKISILRGFTVGPDAEQPGKPTSALTCLIQHMHTLTVLNGMDSRRMKVKAKIYQQSLISGPTVTFPA